MDHLPYSFGQPNGTTPPQLAGYIGSRESDPFIAIENTAGTTTVIPGQTLVPVRTGRLAPSEHSICRDSGYGSTGVGPGRSTYEACAYSDNLRSPGSIVCGVEGGNTDVQTEWRRIADSRTTSSVPDMGGGDRRHTISDTQDGSIPGGVDSGSRDNGRTKAFVCEIPQHECKKQFSTKAELKKHINRHFRPFRCDEPNCTNTRGFGTCNELDRHKKSCHADKLLSNGGYYQCRACTNSAKKWPRADNFRGHLINVHKLKKDVDLNYHFVPERHDIPQVLLGVGGTAISQPSQCEVWQPFPDITGTRTDQAQNGRSSADLMELTDGVQTSASLCLHPDLDDCFIQIMTLGRDAPNQLMYLGNRVQYDQFSVPISLAECRMPPSEGEALLAYGQMLPQNISSFAGTSVYADGEVGYSTSDSPLAADAEDIGPQPLPEAEVGTGDGGGMDCEVLKETCEYAQEQEEQDSQDNTTVRVDLTHDKTNADEIITGEGSCISNGIENADEGESDCTAESSKTMTDQTVIGLTQETAQPDDHEMTTAVSLSFRSITDVKDMPAAELKVLLETLAHHKSFNSVVKDLAASARPAPTPMEEDKTDCSNKTSQSTIKGDYVCVRCENLFRSKASLTKHQKRHDRPYGCTAPNCNKVFGSKNDWKRHERGQHFKLETWKCQEKVETTSNGSAASDEAGNKASNDASGKPKLCDRRFYLCEEFMSHLEEHHGICEARKREEKAKCCLSGGKHDQHWSFWCGFCKTKIPGPSDRDNALRGSLSGPGKKHNKKRGADEGAESKSKGGEMAKDFDAFLRWRSDHIDAHFVGRGENNKQDISKWVHMDAAGRLGNQAAGSSSSAAQKRGYERAAGGSRGGRLPFKKRKTAVWFCCRCQAFQTSTNVVCTESCSHRRCSDCGTE